MEQINKLGYLKKLVNDSNRVIIVEGTSWNCFQIFIIKIIVILSFENAEDTKYLFNQLSTDIKNPSGCNVKQYALYVLNNQNLITKYIPKQEIENAFENLCKTYSNINNDLF